MPKFETTRQVRQAPSRATILKRGYLALGTILELALIAASYTLRLEHLQYSTYLFLIAGGFSALWGICWGVWDRQMFRVWATMESLATVALLGAAFLDFRSAGLLAAMLGAAGAEFALWVIFSAIAIASCKER